MIDVNVFSCSAFVKIRGELQQLLTDICVGNIGAGTFLLLFRNKSSMILPAIHTSYTCSLAWVFAAFLPRHSLARYLGQGLYRKQFFKQNTLGVFFEKGASMNFFLGIARGIDRITGFIGRLMAWLTLFLVLVGSFNVFTRYGFSLISDRFGEDVAHALSGNRYLELQTYAFSLIFLLGAAYVFRKDGHVRVDIIFSSLGNKVKAWIDIIATFVMLFPFCWLVVYTSRSYIAKSWKVMEISQNPGGLPLYPLKTMIIVAFCLLFLQGISEVIKNIAFVAGVENSGSVHAPENHNEESNQTNPLGEETAAEATA